MRLKNLEQQIQKSDSKTLTGNNLDKLMSNLYGKPFYCSKPGCSNNYCCLWHCFPPKKPDNSYSELYTFQASLVRDLQVHKRIALLKARNLGSTQSP